MTSAEAAGFEVDPDMLIGARNFLQKLWREDANKYAYQLHDAKSFALESHGSAVTALQLGTERQLKHPQALYGEKHK